MSMHKKYTEACREMKAAKDMDELRAARVKWLDSREFHKFLPRLQDDILALYERERTRITGWGMPT